MLMSIDKSAHWYESTLYLLIHHQTHSIAQCRLCREKRFQWKFFMTIQERIRQLQEQAMGRDNEKNRVERNENEINF